MRKGTETDRQTDTVCVGDGARGEAVTLRGKLNQESENPVYGSLGRGGGRRGGKGEDGMVEEKMVIAKRRKRGLVGKSHNYHLPITLNTWYILLREEPLF